MVHGILLGPPSQWGWSELEAPASLQAAAAFTAALAESPADPVLLGNRAMVRIKLGQWEEAEADAAAAVALDPSYAKGFHRRASARKAGWGRDGRNLRSLARRGC